jgi:hypothetical protein
MARRHVSPVLLGLVTVILSTVAALGACEGLARLIYAPLPEENVVVKTEGGLNWIARGPDGWLTYDERYGIPHPTLGILPRPNFRSRGILKQRGKVIYDIALEIDSFSRRVTPQSGLKRRKRFLTVFGCSFMYGEGVKGNETLPASLAARAPGYHVYNYAFSGSGPNSVLARMRTIDFAREVSEKEGIGIYTYMEAHPIRAIGSMAIVTNWGPWLPYFTVNGKDEVVWHGTFRDARPVIQFFYTLLSKSRLLEHLNLDVPPVLLDSDFRFTARLILEAKREFQARTGGQKFYVLIYPYTQNAPRLIPYLKEFGIDYIDYSTMPLDELTDHHVLIPVDGHPTARALGVVAARLAHDLGIDDAP